MRPPDGEDKFARPQGGSQRPLGLYSPGSVGVGPGLAPLAHEIGCQVRVAEPSVCWDHRTLEKVVTQPGERTHSLRGLCIFPVTKGVSSPISMGTRGPLPGCQAVVSEGELHPVHRY